MPKTLGKRRARFKTAQNAEYGALSTDLAGIDAELQVIIDVWPRLSDDTKAGIVAMVRATMRK